jgi:hypothetical protein
MFENATCENIMFASAQLLCNWHEQQPSKKDDLDSSVTWEARRSNTQGWTCL